MNRNASCFLAILLILLAFSLTGNRLAGQSPKPPLPLPSQMPIPSMSQGSGTQKTGRGPQEKIRDVLQGQQPAPTGDGVLEDVLGVIQRQGSVLDGSVLDKAPPAERENGTQSKSISNSLTQRAHVAEQLLRSARMLESISDDESSTELVASIRRQAGILLVAGESPTR